VRRLLVSEYFILYLTLTFFVIAAILFPTLRLPLNIANQLQNMWPLLAVAIGQTFVLIIGGIDLSQGAVMGITSVTGAILMATIMDAPTYDKSPLWGTFMTPDGGILGQHPNGWLVAVIFMLLLGAGIGFLNGYAITRFNIAPFMVTLVSLTFFAAFALWLTQSRNVANLPQPFLDLGGGDIISVFLGPKLEPQIPRREVLPFITYPFVISIGLAVVASLILNRTAFGRQMFSIGTNRRASAVSGVPSRRVVIMVYMFSGFCAAIASILYSARLEIGQPSLGSGNILLDIIGAVVIGGTSLFGGKGSIKGTVFGVAFFVLLLNILNAARLSPFIIDAVKGGFILIAALLDITRTRLLSREGRA
jgi:ribose/xylose/arabinose/galactoside ABC-type transport system permease subunit